MLFPRSVGWRAVALLLLASIWLALPHTARAAGFELTPEGARANGRAGANYVGGDSPMSLLYNPANIGRDQTTFNAAGSLHFHFNKRCMTPVVVTETETPAGSGNYVRGQGATLSKECSDGPITILPELGLSLRLGDHLALGLGVQVPAVAYRDFHFGNPYTGTADGQPDGQPTSTRYLLVREKQLQEFTTIGASYEINRDVRVGASFGWGITTLDYTNTAYSRALVNVNLPIIGDLNVGTVTADALNRLKAADYFVPRIQVGAWVRPIIDVPIELGAAFQWTGNIKTHSAKLELHGYNPQLMTIAGQLVTLDSLQADGTVSGVGLNVPQTSQLAFGIRYADKLDEPADKVGDRLSTERFDIEGDMAITFGKHVDAFRVDIPDAAQLTANATITAPIIGQTTIQQMVDLPNYLQLEHKWKTQISLRVGSDINVVPGLLALRAGLDIETNGVKKGYQQIDYMPTTRIGAHLGCTVRIAHKVDLSFAYAHIFQPTTNVSYTDAQVLRVATVTDSSAATPPTPTPADAPPVNAGKITNHANVLILAAGAHF
jgi:hypothetical protein